MRQRQPCVYLLARASHSTLYVGVTSDLTARIWQHREETADGFTKRYGIKRLVWFEMHETMDAAIAREKSIKRWPRAWKYAGSTRPIPPGAISRRNWGSTRCRGRRRIPAQGRDDGSGCVRRRAR
jgi:putative endonuclease